jgi:hypothetical protein
MAQLMKKDTLVIAMNQFRISSPLPALYQHMQKLSYREIHTTQTHVGQDDTHHTSDEEHPAWSSLIIDISDE